MSEHAKVSKPQKTNAAPASNQLKSIPIRLGSHPSAIIQRARMCPESLTQADVMQLQRTIGNRAAMQLFKDIVLMESAQKNGPVQEKVEPSENNKKILPETFQTKENNTGLPDDLKSGVENLSGLSMDDVKVHYNSDKPVQVGALAYTQGIDIHVAPGMDRHLPHEAWHVVQQKQGKVQPTMHINDMAVNDDTGLEWEADMMGEKSAILNESQKEFQNIADNRSSLNFISKQKKEEECLGNSRTYILQRKLKYFAADGKTELLGTKQEDDCMFRNFFHGAFGDQKFWLNNNDAVKLNNVKDGCFNTEKVTDQISYYTQGKKTFNEKYQEGKIVDGFTKPFLVEKDLTSWDYNTLDWIRSTDLYEQKHVINKYNGKMNPDEILDEVEDGKTCHNAYSERLSRSVIDKALFSSMPKASAQIEVLEREPTEQLLTVYELEPDESKNNRALLKSHIIKNKILNEKEFDAIEKGWGVSQNHSTPLLHEALSKLPTYKGIVYRRTKLDKKTLELLQKGQTLTIPSLLKPEMNGKILATTPNNPGVDISYGQYLFIIYSKTGKYVSHITDMEEEVLFHGDTSFVLVGEDNGVFYFEEK